MTRSLLASIFAVAILVSVGCDDLDGVDRTSQSATARTCPEPTTPDDRGSPRNAAGYIRYCWPGEANCICDRDDDCYPLEGYIDCAQPVTDAGASDVGEDRADSRDAGPADAGPRDTGLADTGRADTRVFDSAPAITDNVVYTGSFRTTSGRYRARLTVAGAVRDVWVYAPSSRGSRPPLLLAFHGTNGDGDVMLTESGAQAVANTYGVVVVAPTSRWIDGPDFDHPDGSETYWETRNTNRDTNPDLLLARASMVEAARRYNIDQSRTYAIGHSNGGFMALLVSVALRDRIAAFGENSAGLVRCAQTRSCRFLGSDLTCAQLQAQPGWCSCTGPELPVALPTMGRRVPGYLSHGSQDPTVSVYYTCALASRLEALGFSAQTHLWAGGHYLDVSFAPNAWAFMSRFTLP